MLTFCLCLSFTLLTSIQRSLNSDLICIKLFSWRHEKTRGLIPVKVITSKGALRSCSNTDMNFRRIRNNYNSSVPQIFVHRLYQEITAFWGRLIPFSYRTVLLGRFQEAIFNILHSFVNMRRITSKIFLIFERGFSVKHVN